MLWGGVQRGCRWSQLMPGYAVAMIAFMALSAIQIIALFVSLDTDIFDIAHNPICAVPITSEAPGMSSIGTLKP
jgi:hypothetical protein